MNSNQKKISELQQQREYLRQQIKRTEGWILQLYKEKEQDELESLGPDTNTNYSFYCLNYTKFQLKKAKKELKILVALQKNVKKQLKEEIAFSKYYLFLDAYTDSFNQQYDIKNRGE